MEYHNSQVAELLTKKYITTDTINKKGHSTLLEKSADQDIEQNFESSDFDDISLCSDTKEKYLQEGTKNNSQNKQFNISAAIIAGIAVLLALAYASWLPVLEIIIVTTIVALTVGKLFTPSSVLDEVIYNKIDENLLSR